MEILLHGAIALPNEENLKERLIISGNTEIKGSFPALATGKDSSGRIDPKT
jgi:hypothetical protein